MLLAFLQPNNKINWVLSKNFDILWLFYLTLSWSRSWWEGFGLPSFHSKQFGGCNISGVSPDLDRLFVWTQGRSTDRDVFKQALKEFVYLVTLRAKYGLKTHSFSLLMRGFLSRQTATSWLSRWSVKIASHSWGPQRAPPLSGQILYPHLYKVQMGMYCKSSRLNSFVTKETSVEILPPAVRRDTEPLPAILPLTEGWRNGQRRQTVSPQCSCPIEKGFHGECGSHGPAGGKWSPGTVWPLSGTLPRPILCVLKNPANGKKKKTSFPFDCARATHVSAFNISTVCLY